jgi:hypothetical protein
MFTTISFLGFACRTLELQFELDYFYIRGLLELADQNNTVISSSSGNNRKNILKNPSSLDFKIRTLLIDQSRVDIKYLKKLY